MTKDQIQKSMKLLESFCRDMMGNTMTIWSAKGFMDEANKMFMEFIHETRQPNDAKNITK